MSHVNLGQHLGFQPPDIGMMYHLKLLFVKAKVDNVVVNKIFVDGEASVNLMLHSLFKKIGKSNIKYLNYEG